MDRYGESMKIMLLDSEIRSLSIVAPVYNEVENLPLLYQEICSAMADVGLPWELVLVDDGSTDGSTQLMQEMALEHPDHLIAVSFRRNFGQTAAIAAGIEHASGDVIVLIDADLQNNPADIPLMLDKLREGYDVVSGWRKDRRDTFINRTLPSRIANRLISHVTGVHLHDYGCTLKAYRREVLTGFRLYGEMHRFIPAYAGSVGARIVEMPVRHSPRRYGKTKYGIERTVKVILDLFTVKFLMSYAAKPIYLFGGTGVFLMLASTIMLLFLMARRLWVGTPVLDSPLFIGGIMLLLMGFQAVLMGLIAELLVRTYHESQQKPPYTIRWVIGRDRVGNQ